MTKRQAEALHFICAFLDKHGHSPSFAEIINHLGLRSVSGASRLVGALIREGFLTRSPQCARTLIPTAKAIQGKYSGIVVSEDNRSGLRAAYPGMDLSAAANIAIRAHLDGRAG